MEWKKNVHDPLVDWLPFVKSFIFDYDAYFISKQKKTDSTSPMLPWKVTNTMPFETESYDIGWVFYLNTQLCLERKKTYRHSATVPCWSTMVAWNKAENNFPW